MLTFQSCKPDYTQINEKMNINNKGRNCNNSLSYPSQIIFHTFERYKHQIQFP